MKCSKFFFICQIILTIHCVLFAIQSTAQAPQSFNYQAVVRDSTGALVANQPIGIRASIVADSANGTVVYQETHSINSNDFGLIHLQIGTGSAVSGTFDAIDWSTGTFFTKIEMDETGGTNYQPLSIAPLSSVPYALYAQNVANKDDADADPANELQTISKSGSTVTLSNGGGSFTDAVDDADADPANEIQDITLSGTELTISNGSTIDLSIIQCSSGTDGDWSFNGANLYAAVGGNVGIGAVSPFHKLQVRNTVTDDVLRLQGPDGSYEHGARLNFGDADYVYLDEDEDDKLTIQASGRIALTTGGPIRFDVAGTERWEMIGTRLQPQNTLSLIHI